MIRIILLVAFLMISFAPAALAAGSGDDGFFSTALFRAEPHCSPLVNR